ncbi:DEAD/DEAH box RNA helicase, partial [Penicillium capsulatum]
PRPASQLFLGSTHPRNEEAARLAREQGWTDPVPYDYARYQDKTSRDWASIAARYEWKEEYGDVGPPNKELEEQLFHHDFLPRAGLRFDERQWTDAGLHPIMLENINLCMYDSPTSVQCYALPTILKGKDLMAVAQTGSGKTAAFFIPIISKLMGKAKKWAAPRPEITENYNPYRDGVIAKPLVMVVCPTRELATQIFDEARRLCYRSMLRPCVVYGGSPVSLQRDELRKGCDILIGTPGRIMDFMRQPGVLSFKNVKFTVIDEADELLHSDWENDLKHIMSGGGKHNCQLQTLEPYQHTDPSSDVNEDEDHQYMMFSATFDKECRALARQYLSTDHVRLRVGRPGSSHLNVHQQVIYVDQNQKKVALSDLLKSMLPVRTLIFVNNKKTVDEVDDYLYHNGFPSTSIHSDRTQREREDAVRSFRKAESPIMVGTGVSSRGLDIVNVMHVVNYDLPTPIHGGITEYIHRIGRTARIGNEGIATSFYTHRDVDIASDLVNVLLECKQEDDATDDEDKEKRSDTATEPFVAAVEETANELVASDDETADESVDSQTLGEPGPSEDEAETVNVLVSLDDEDEEAPKDSKDSNASVLVSTWEINDDDVMW